jgi:hypothetical protein
MAATTLTVTVNGGKTPVSIVINLFKGGQHVTGFIKTETFKFEFTSLTKGDYSLFIGGVNPLPKGSTKCELTKDEITLHPPDDSPITKRGIKYLVQFHFTV